jgi:hypothetical protein
MAGRTVAQEPRRLIARVVAPGGVAADVALAVRFAVRISGDGNRERAVREGQQVLGRDVAGAAVAEIWLVARIVGLRPVGAGGAVTVGLVVRVARDGADVGARIEGAGCHERREETRPNSDDGDEAGGGSVRAHCGGLCVCVCVCVDVCGWTQRRESGKEQSTKTLVWVLSRRGRCQIANREKKTRAFAPQKRKNTCRGVGGAFGSHKSLCGTAETFSPCGR